METNAEKLVRLAPKLTEREKKQINARFQAYIFRRGKTGEVWTTCCGVHKRLDSAATGREYALLAAPHTPAPDFRWGKDKNAPNSLARVECPWCGARAAVKEIQYTGQRKNLWEFRRVLTLRQWRGALWACAYDCTKDYGCVERSTEGPNINLLRIYRFRPGKAECAGRDGCWYDNGPIRYYQCQTAPGKGKNLWTTERPFGWCNEYGLGYETIGMEEIGKSAFRYCGAKQLGLSDEVTRTLTACCFYPRQIEFLMKCGMEDAVRDLVVYGRKNAAAIHWDAETPAEFLGVKPRELRWLQEAGKYSWERVEALGLYRRQKGNSALADCLRFAEIRMDGNKQKMLLKRMREHGVSIGRLLRYMNKHCLKKRTIRSAMDAYVDYLVAAEGVGLDLNNPIFLMPRDFEEKHDQVTAAWSAVLAERRRKAEAERRAAVAEERKKQLERFRGRVKSLARRYTYTDGELLVRPAVNAEEIVREGKLLHHCVGGYADRHISGATTILFLRRRSTPRKPLCTIEMNGNSIRQIHGWDDERTACEDNPNRENPRNIYAEFLNEWTAWLKGGSKRDKAGRPIIRKKKARKTA